MIKWIFVRVKDAKNVGPGVMDDARLIRTGGTAWTKSEIKRMKTGSSVTTSPNPGTEVEGR